MVGDLRIRIAKLASHAKESPIRTRDEVFNLVSSQSWSPADDDSPADDGSADDGSPAIRTPPNPGLPHHPNVIVACLSAEEVHTPPGQLQDKSLPLKIFKKPQNKISTTILKITRNSRQQGKIHTLVCCQSFLKQTQLKQNQLIWTYRLGDINAQSSGQNI